MNLFRETFAVLLYGWLIHQGQSRGSKSASLSIYRRLIEAVSLKKARVKKVVKYRWWPRNGCGGSSVADEFVADSLRSWDEETQIHLNCRYL